HRPSRPARSTARRRREQPARPPRRARRRRPCASAAEPTTATYSRRRRAARHTWPPTSRWPSSRLRAHASSQHRTPPLVERAGAARVTPERGPCSAYLDTTDGSRWLFAAVEIAMPPDRESVGEGRRIE